MTVGLLVSVAACPGLITSRHSLAGESFDTVLPDAQSFSHHDAASAAAAPLPNAMPQAPVGNKLFPEIKEEVESLDSKEQLQESCQNTDSPSHWLNVVSSSHQPEEVRKPVCNDWSLENGQLRAAELESELASRSEEFQQLSAHLLQATRQLAVVGQPVQAPGATQVEIAGKAVHGNKIMHGILLLMLAGTCWMLLTALKAYPVTSQQQADNAYTAEQVR